MLINKCKAHLVEQKSKGDKTDEEHEHKVKTTVKFTMDLGPGNEDAMAELFPGLKAVQDAISEFDGDHPGVELKSCAMPPPLFFVVQDGSGTSDVFRWQNVTLQGKAKMTITSLGSGRIEMTFVASVSREDMSKFSDYLDADVYISTAEQQLDLFSDNERGVAEAFEAQAPDATTMTALDFRALRMAMGWEVADVVEEFGHADLPVNVRDVQAWDDGERPIPHRAAVLMEQLTS